MQIDKCFGFDTAVEEAQRALMAAKVEASSAFRGIGIVKLMGRQSGFIAMQVQLCNRSPELTSLSKLGCITPHRLATCNATHKEMPIERGT